MFFYFLIYDKIYIKEDDKMNNNSNPYSRRLKYSIIFAISVIFIALFAVGVQNIKILNTHGHSMQPTIQDNSYVICIKSNSIERGDMIAFSRRGEMKIKRVVGLPNEKITINEEGRVYIGNELLKENYVSNFNIGQVEIKLPHTIDNDSVFVLGDNRENSLDSRHLQISDIKIDEIICEVQLVI